MNTKEKTKAKIKKELIVTLENNLNIGAGFETPEQFLKQQEKLNNINKEHYLKGIKKLTSDINSLITKSIEKYNVDIVVKSKNTEVEVIFNLDLSV